MPRTSTRSAVKASCGAIALVLVLGACGGSGGRPTVETELRDHLLARKLSVRWVRCVPGPGPTWRCNVNFGDPHVQIYCAAVVDGKLRAAEWRPAEHGRQDRAASARECVRRLGEPG